MQYILLIYESEALWGSRTDAEKGAIFGGYKEFTESIVKSGNFKGGDPLQMTSDATTVQVRNGETLQADGPFAETKEQLGGYYLVEAADLDEAVKIAARIPTAQTGSVG